MAYSPSPSASAWSPRSTSSVAACQSIRDTVDWAEMATVWVRQGGRAVSLKSKFERISILAVACLVVVGCSESSDIPDTPSVNVGQAHTLRYGLFACRTAEEFEKLMALGSAHDQNSVSQYFGDGTCVEIKEGTRVSVTDESGDHVEVTIAGESFWTLRDHLAANAM